MREYYITCDYFGHHKLLYACPSENLEMVARRYVYNSFLCEDRRPVQRDILFVTVEDCSDGKSVEFEVTARPDIFISCVRTETVSV